MIYTFVVVYSSSSAISKPATSCQTVHRYAVLYSCRLRQKSDTEREELNSTSVDGLFSTVGIGHGVAEIDNKVFVLGLREIHVFDAQTFKDLSVIQIKEWRGACDIVACSDDHQLYFSADSGILRVSTTDPYHEEKWMQMDRSGDQRFGRKTLWLKSRRLLVTSPSSLHQYDTTNKRLLRVVECPEHMQWMYHGVETTRGTFVISYQCTAPTENPLFTLLDKGLHAVSVNCFRLPCI